MKNLEKIDSKFLPYIITTIVIAVVSFIFLMFTQIYFIDQGEKAVITNFGKISNTWSAGFHVKVPFVQSVKRYSVRVQKTVFGAVPGGK